MKRILWTLAAAAAVALVGAASVVAQEAKPDGKAVFEAQKCTMCHSVPAAGIAATAKSEKMKGPDLPGPSLKEPAAVVQFLKKESDIGGEKHKKEWKGTDDELSAVAAWVLKPGK